MITISPVLGKQAKPTNVDDDGVGCQLSQSIQVQHIELIIVMSRVVRPIL